MMSCMQISCGTYCSNELIALMFIFKVDRIQLIFFISVFNINYRNLVALLQAYIFTVLSALYFGFAVEEHEH